MAVRKKVKAAVVQNHKMKKAKLNQRHPLNLVVILLRILDV